MQDKQKIIVPSTNGSPDNLNVMVVKYPAAKPMAIAPKITDNVLPIIKPAVTSSGVVNATPSN